MKLTMDFETRSAAKLGGQGSVGAWRYAEDPTTDVMCCAVRLGKDAPRIWLPEYFRDLLPAETKLPFIDSLGLFSMITAASSIEAHNAMFERAIWKRQCETKHGWPEFPAHKMRCSMAKALMHGLPAGLDEALDALDLGVSKDQGGKKIMLKLCKPRRPTKNNPNIWNEDPADLEKLCWYCLQDIKAEEALSNALIDLPPYEQKVWMLDQDINERGIPVDLENVDRIIDAITAWEEELTNEMQELTEWQVGTVKQHAKALAWVKSRGVHLADIQKATVVDVLKSELPADVRRFLEIRQSLGKSSVAKFAAFKRCACADGRVRGTQIYHKAGTGRWAGALVQPQNMPRGTFKDVDRCLDVLKEEGFTGVEFWFGDPMEAMSTCIRGMIAAPAGKTFTVSDYSSIEARVNAAIAGELESLQSYRDGLDTYKVAASGIFGAPYEAVNSDQRQVGKVSELALGYGGGIGAYASMAKGYGVDLEALPAFVLPSAPDDVIRRAREMAETYTGRTPDAEMSLEAAAACDVIKQLWRKQHPHIVSLWKELENAAGEAVRSAGTVQHCRNGIAYKCQKDGRFLLCRLPSGRRLFYPFPALRRVKTPWGEEKHTVTCRTVDGVTRQWVRRALYGGLLCENCFAKGTLVVTQRGPVPIEYVNERDLIWDGEEWVSQDGPVNQGKQEVGWWLGLRVTPGHEVFNGQVWTSVSSLDSGSTRACLSWASEGMNSKCINLKGFCSFNDYPSWFYNGKEEVFDLLNCGPRSRFTILTSCGPVVVHNCVQATSRDILVAGMLRVEAAGYRLIFHVHDEAVSENDLGFGSQDEFDMLLATRPAWAAAYPIEAKGWTGVRYKK